jgi:hypothetical protein
LYINRPDPILFLPTAVDTTRRVYDDLSRLLFLHDHREASGLTNEIPEESGQFRFLRTDWYTNIKGSVGLILTKSFHAFIWCGYAKNMKISSNSLHSRWSSARLEGRIPSSQHICDVCSIKDVKGKFMETNAIVPKPVDQFLLKRKHNMSIMLQEV